MYSISSNQCSAFQNLDISLEDSNKNVSTMENGEILDGTVYSPSSDFGLSFAVLCLQELKQQVELMNNSNLLHEESTHTAKDSKFYDNQNNSDHDWHEIENKCFEADESEPPRTQMQIDLKTDTVMTSEEDAIKLESKEISDDTKQNTSTATASPPTTASSSASPNPQTCIPSPEQTSGITQPILSSIINSTITEVPVSEPSNNLSVCNSETCLEKSDSDDNSMAPSFTLQEIDFPSLQDSANSKKTQTALTKPFKRIKKWKGAPDLENEFYKVYPIPDRLMSSHTPEEIAIMDEELLKFYETLDKTSDDDSDVKKSAENNTESTPNEGVQIQVETEKKFNINQETSNCDTQEQKTEHSPKQTQHTSAKDICINSSVSGVENLESLSDNFECLECDCDSYEEIETKIPESQLLFLESFHTLNGRLYLRRKHKWRREKARKQVKSKQCKDVSNKRHGTSILINHRFYKNITSLARNSHFMPGRKLKDIDLRGSESPISGRSCNVRAANGFADRYYPKAVPRPRHALNRNNADNTLEDDLVNILINLQDREISPEDYDLLLRLDERVAPKTVDESFLTLLPTHEFSESDEVSVCSICMESYVVGQTVKELPCQHCFHVNCVDSWLKFSSTTCPLDGLPVQ